MDKYLYWLANVSGLGTACRERLLEAFGTGAAVEASGHGTGKGEGGKAVGNTEEMGRGQGI